MDTMYVSSETLRLLKIMYDPEELAIVLMEMRNSDGWLSISFTECPVLCPMDIYVTQNWRLN